MKKIFLGILLLAASTLVNAQEIKKVKAVDIVKMMDTTNHPLVINLWTTWCGPCVNELKYFEKVVDKFKDNNVELILISLDYPEDFAKVAPFVAKKGYKLKVTGWMNKKLALFKQLLTEVLKVQFHFQSSAIKPQNIVLLTVLN